MPDRSIEARQRRLDVAGKAGCTRRWSSRRWAMVAHSISSSRPVRRVLRRPVASSAGRARAIQQVGPKSGTDPRESGQPRRGLTQVLIPKVVAELEKLQDRLRPTDLSSSAASDNWAERIQLR